MTTAAGLDLVVGEPDEEFWRGLGGGVVRFPRCTHCTTWVWPARSRCPACLVERLVWETVEPVGTVYSWTRTWYPFAAERAADVPYVIGLVEVPAAGSIRVLGIIEGDSGGSDTPIEIGAGVRGHIAEPTAQTLGLASLRWRIDR